jgi:hypothetical protein
MNKNALFYYLQNAVFLSVLYIYTYIKYAAIYVQEYVYNGL